MGTNPLKHNDEIFHQNDYKLILRNLNGFYGKINNNQNELIYKTIVGNRVLDIGAGIGNLTLYLKNKGVDVTGIDLDDESINQAKKINNIEILKGSIYDLPFDDKSVDTIIVKETLFHLDFEQALKEIKRILKKQLIIFETRESIIIKLGHIIIGHKEYNQHTTNYYKKLLIANGFKIESVINNNIISLPLSGGLIAPQILPRIGILEDLILSVESLVENILNSVGIKKLLRNRELINSYICD